MSIGLSLVLSSAILNVSWGIGTWGWTAIICGICIFEVVIFPDTKWLSWASSIGVVNTWVCCAVLAIVLVDLIPRYPSLWSSFTSYTIFEVEGFFLGCNTLLVSFYTSQTLPSIYMEMQEKDRADDMLLRGHLIPLVTKLVLMITVFYAYQDDTEEIAIWNVENFTLRTILAVCIVVDKLVTIPLWLYPNRCELHTFFENQLEPDVWKHLVQNRFIGWMLPTIEGVILLIPSFSLSLLVPNYWTYTVLFGCVFITPQTLTLPTIQWLILTKKKPILKQLLAFVICLFGIVISIGGLFFL